MKTKKISGIFLEELREQIFRNFNLTFTSLLNFPANRTQIFNQPSKQKR